MPPKGKAKPAPKKADPKKTADAGAAVGSPAGKSGAARKDAKPGGKGKKGKGKEDAPDPAEQGAQCPKCKNPMVPLEDEFLQEHGDVEAKCDGCDVPFLVKTANDIGVLACHACDVSLCRMCNAPPQQRAAEEALCACAAVLLGAACGVPPAAARTPPVAAATLQRCGRGLKERVAVIGTWKAGKQASFEEEAERLRAESRAWQAKRAEKEDAKREQKKKEAELKKKEQQEMFQAAMDGDIAKMKELRERGQHCNVHIVDAAGNTLLGETANAGHLDAVKFLLDLRCNPNKRCEHDRTPLFSAAMGLHIEVCKLLLDRGADPRIYATGAEKPEDVASGPTRDLLTGWDVSKTESIMAKLQEEQDAREAKMKAEEQAAASEAEAEVAKIEQKIKAAGQRYAQQAEVVQRAQVGMDQLSMLNPDPHKLEQQSRHLADSQKLKQEIKAEMEQLQHEMYEARLHPSLASLRTEDDVEEIHFKSLQDVVVDDKGGRIAMKGKWPLVIDYSGRVKPYLQYRNTNFSSATSPQMMEPEKLRRSLIGAIRWGKPLVLDLMDINVLDFVKERFDGIQKGLWKSLLTRDIIQNQKYESLIRESDGKEYLAREFRSMYIDNFRFIVLSSCRMPSPEMLQTMFPVRIEEY